MFNNQNFTRYGNNQNLFFSQQGGNNESQSAYFSSSMSQNPYKMPINFMDNCSSFSGSNTSTNASISQMTSLYMANQRKKAFTGEINLCLTKSLERILPEIAKQTAEVIYNSLSETLLESEKNIRELKNSIETLKNTLKSCTFLTKKCNSMKTINSVYSNLNIATGNLNNCGVLLNNQIKFAQGNEEFKEQQQELINNIVQKFDEIKILFGKQKEFSAKLNDSIKTSLANIIATKTSYKNELIKMQDNIKYDIINNISKEKNNEEKLISDISSTLKKFKDKVDSATNIYPPNNNVIKEIKSNSEKIEDNLDTQGKIDINQNNNSINTNTINQICSENNNNYLGKLFIEVGGKGFKF